MDERFGKAYKLCNKKIIAELFKSAKSVYSHPLKIIYLNRKLKTEKAFQIAIAVPKRNFKKAPHRNKIRRRIKEAVRKNKTPLEKALINDKKQLALFLIYLDKQTVGYSDIEKKIVFLFDRLIKEVKK